MAEHRLWPVSSANIELPAEVFETIGPQMIVSVAFTVVIVKEEPVSQNWRRHQMVGCVFIQLPHFSRRPVL